MLLTAGANVIVRALLAPACAACDTPLLCPVDSPVCDACWRAVSPIPAPCCVRCGEPLWTGAGPACPRCAAHEPAFAIARSAARYDGPLRDVIHAFKFERRRVLATPLAALMRRAGHDLLAGADAVVPVPLHPWRALRRGFNQADDLASRLGPPVWRILHRTRGGPPQSALAGAERRANVAGAFAIRYGVRLVAARRRTAAVVLVDDVMTTGATLDACAQALRRAGVRQVAALTLARAATPPGPPPGPPRPRRPSTAPRR